MKKTVFISVLAYMCIVICYAQNQSIIAFDTISIDCLDYKLKEEIIIIEKKQDYLDLDYYRDGNCSTLPEIDFEQKILVGRIVVLTDCCDVPTYTASLEKVKDDYVINLTLFTKGSCRMIIRKIYWFTLDKPRENFAVKFQMNYSKE